MQLEDTVFSSFVAKAFKMCLLTYCINQALHFMPKFNQTETEKSHKEKSLKYSRVIMNTDYTFFF